MNALVNVNTIKELWTLSTYREPAASLSSLCAFPSPLSEAACGSLPAREDEDRIELTLYNRGADERRFAFRLRVGEYTLIAKWDNGISCLAMVTNIKGN